MRHSIFTIAISLSFLLALSCAKKEEVSNGPHATVFLRDGTTYAGTVKSSSPKEITLAGDDNTTRTIAMKDVQSVEYGEPAATLAETRTPASTPEKTDRQGATPVAPLAERR